MGYKFQSHQCISQELTTAAVGENVKRAIHYDPRKVTVHIERDEVISLPTFSNAVVFVFGLIYALNLAYPKAMYDTFDFIQKVLMGLDSGTLKHKLLALKNDLLRNRDLVV